MVRQGLLRVWMLLALVLLLARPAPACLWDSDTLATEASGQLDVLNVLVGRFDRFPPRYYEMRLERVARLIEADSSKIALYDDAGVACDRLHRSDEAIAWMARKRQVLDRMPEGDPVRREHEYRYLANLGTFHVHRWIGAGADRESMDDLKKGRDLIAAAIELNPDAHFGREEYQLYAIDWLIDPPPMPTKKNIYEWDTLRSYPDLLSEDQLRAATPAELERATKGLAGLVALGAAAESPDVFRTLASIFYAKGEHSMSHVASTRLFELHHDGRRSLHPAADHQSDDLIRDWASSATEAFSESDPRLGRWYMNARAATEQWRTARMAYLEAMFAKGQHPDTHPGIWAKAPDSPPLPAMPGEGARRWSMLNPPPGILWGLLAGLVVLIAVAVVQARRRAAIEDTGG